MRDATFHPDETFVPAPAGTSVRISTIAVIAIMAVILPLAVWKATEAKAPGWVDVVVPMSVLALLGLVAWTARIRAYRLQGSVLSIDRPLWPVRVPLEGLESIEADRDALKGAIRLIGNGGLGAISGRFRSRRLGAFRAYVTDGDKAVVLRAGGRVWVVSPDRTRSFIEAVRRRAAGR